NNGVRSRTAYACIRAWCTRISCQDNQYGCTITPAGMRGQPRRVAADARCAHFFDQCAQTGSERMDNDEILTAGYWGVLTAVEAGAPYAVPVIYGWDGQAAYVLMQPGRKERALRGCTAACLSVCAGDGGTVLVRGRGEWVEELTKKAHAADVVRRQMAGRRAPSIRDAARLVRAQVLKLVPLEVTRLEAP